MIDGLTIKTIEIYKIIVLKNYVRYLFQQFFLFLKTSLYSTLVYDFFYISEKKICKLTFHLEGWTEFAFAMLETSKIILIKNLSFIFNSNSDDSGGIIKHMYCMWHTGLWKISNR